jgi:hypothetical protein
VSIVRVKLAPCLGHKKAKRFYIFMRESFVFYRSFYDAIKGLPLEQQAKIYNAISEYCFYQKQPKLDKISQSFFTLIKPQLDASNKRWEQCVINGKKGAEYGKLGGRPKKEKPQTKPLKKPQTKPISKPLNDNVNYNLNHNHNHNDNVNYNLNQNKINDEIKNFKDNVLKYMDIVDDIEKLIDFYEHYTQDKNGIPLFLQIKNFTLERELENYMQQKYGLQIFPF